LQTKGHYKRQGERNRRNPFKISQSIEVFSRGRDSRARRGKKEEEKGTIVVEEMELRKERSDSRRGQGGGKEGSRIFL